MNQILDILVGTGFLAALCVLGKKVLALGQAYVQAKTDEFLEKTKNEKFKNCIFIAENAIFSVVDQLSQEVVDDIKASSADGKLSEQEKMDIKNIAKKRSMEIISEEVKYGLTMIFDDIDGWIDSKIDSFVRKSKKIS